MNKLFNQLSEFFEKQGWNHHQHGDAPVIHTQFNGKSGRWMTAAIVHDDEESVSFLSFFPSVAMPARRAAVAELLTRINYNLRPLLSGSNFQ